MICKHETLIQYQIPWITKRTIRSVLITYIPTVEVSLSFFFLSSKYLLRFFISVPKFMIMEAFIFWKKARLRHYIFLWDLIFSLSPAPTLHKAFTLIAILLNHRHMIRVLFHTFLYCLKHLMPLRKGLLHVIHVEVQNKWLVDWRERLEDHIHIQLIKKSKNNHVRALNVTHCLWLHEDWLNSLSLHENWNFESNISQPLNGSQCVRGGSIGHL